MISEGLGPSELLKLVSSIKDFDKQKNSLSQFRKSLPPLFKNYVQPGKTQQNVEDGLLRVPKFEQDCVGIRAKEGEKKSKEDRADAEIVSVSEEQELVKDVTHGFIKMDLEGKKRRILQPEPETERSVKKQKTSRRLERVITPSYKLIPEEERCPISDNNHVLNNKYSLIKFGDPSGRKKMTKYEEAMARCEDYMFEADMLKEALKSAMENAEKVIKEEMRVEDLGVKFYRCIEKLYGGDMFEIVREDHKKALPVILERLKQKLDEVEFAREIWTPMWKQVFEENTVKQRESTAQGHRKKVKENSKF
ncbi:hypothetical protein N665_0008s0020 [Sinapis alba]|nr:hypothetical protein N665_0008s0020 [Sinapis alba]